VEFASVVDAVRCAVVVQQAMPERDTGVGADNRIELRIGINLGGVIVEGDDLYGDGVNIAARIEALADAGGVFVSNTVHDHVRDRLPFVFEDLGEQQVKNIARPVRVYRVRDIGAAVKSPVQTALSLPDKPSIAVLPFANMSGDPEQEYFADGMVEETTSKNLDPSNSAAFTSPARCQVDSLMDFFGLGVNRHTVTATIQVASDPPRLVLSSSGLTLRTHSVVSACRGRSATNRRTTCPEETTKTRHKQR
jgi:hypothetical protein